LLLLLLTNKFKTGVGIMTMCVSSFMKIGHLVYKWNWKARIHPGNQRRRIHLPHSSASFYRKAGQEFSSYVTENILKTNWLMST
jgi:hypothetical protein